MAQGVELPTKAVGGRLKLLGGDDYIEQLIMTAFGSGESTNPFQSLGLGEFMIFDINAEAIEGEIRQRVLAIFASLERDQLARLRRGSKSIRFESEGGDKVMYLEYINMETGLRQEIEVPLPPAGE